MFFSGNNLKHMPVTDSTVRFCRPDPEIHRMDFRETNAAESEILQRSAKIVFLHTIPEGTVTTVQKYNSRTPGIRSAETVNPDFPERQFL